MSLKAIHLFFVTIFSALCFGCGVWKLRSYGETHASAGDLWFGIAALSLGVAVVVYGRYFLKKLKRFGYL